MPFPNDSTKFPPGRSGNPGGRPKGRTITARCRDLLERGEIDGQPIKNGEQVADLLTRVIVRGALKGDFRIIQWLVERVEHGEETDALWEAIESLRSGPAVGGAGADPGPTPTP